MHSTNDYKALTVLAPEPVCPDEKIVQDNFKALADRFAYLSTSDPAADDDQSLGFAIGSRWYNTATQTEWICIDPTPGTLAVWNKVGFSTDNLFLGPTTFTSSASISLTNLGSLGGWFLASGGTNTPTITLANYPNPAQIQIIKATDVGGAFVVPPFVTSINNNLVATASSGATIPALTGPNATMTGTQGVDYTYSGTVLSTISTVATFSSAGLPVGNAAGTYLIDFATAYGAVDQQLWAYGGTSAGSCRSLFLTYSGDAQLWDEGSYQSGLGFLTNYTDGTRKQIAIRINGNGTWDAFFNGAKAAITQSNVWNTGTGGGGGNVTLFNVQSPPNIHDLPFIGTFYRFAAWDKALTDADCKTITTGGYVSGSTAFIDGTTNAVQLNPQDAYSFYPDGNGAFRKSSFFLSTAASTANLFLGPTTLTATTSISPTNLGSLGGWFLTSGGTNTPTITLAPTYSVNPMQCQIVKATDSGGAYVAGGLSNSNYLLANAGSGNTITDVNGGPSATLSGTDGTDYSWSGTNLTVVSANAQFPATGLPVGNAPATYEFDFQTTFTSSVMIAFEYGGPAQNPTRYISLATGSKFIQFGSGLTAVNSSSAIFATDGSLNRILVRYNRDTTADFFVNGVKDSGGPYSLGPLNTGSGLLDGNAILFQNAVPVFPNLYPFSGTFRRFLAYDSALADTDCITLTTGGYVAGNVPIDGSTNTVNLNQDDAYSFYPDGNGGYRKTSFFSGGISLTANTIAVGQGAVAAYTNSVAIGPNVVVSGSNTVRLGASNTTGLYIEFGNAGLTWPALAHVVSSSGPPTVSAGAGAGTSPTVSINSDGSDSGFILTVTTGTSPAASATIVTVTFAAAFTNTPAISFNNPGNTATASLSGASAICLSSAGTTSFDLLAGTTALAASTTYIWHITCAALNTTYSAGD